MKKLDNYLIAKYDAKAFDENVVCGKDFRFTVIASRLIRMEYSADGIFEDAPTLSIVNRKIDKCAFTVTQDDSFLELETDDLILRYNKTGRFDPYNLEVELKQSVSIDKENVWHYGDKITTLGGTVRTIDTVNGNINLGDGVCAKEGFAVIDDSNTNIILENGMTATRREGVIDVYFFGYAHDYIGAVKDLTRITGGSPLLPAYALGNWWSRYHSYSQEEYLTLMQRFIDEDVPFSVAVLDLGWHKWDIKDAEHREHENGSTWTGYDWDEDLFPDHKALLDWLHQNNLKVTLSLHPSLGIRHTDSVYEEFARAMGIDPASKKAIRFDVTNEEFLNAYFKLAHHPLEEEGVDFWWMDWQQGDTTKQKGLDPLWALNHYHTLSNQRNGKRPVAFSRYSGVGSQRFPVGFSGDSCITWDSLDFQPYLTATSSNIAYPWWSHDIGGHFRGYRDEELTARWVQYGVFSPIMRLHSSSNPYNSREPWMHSEPYQSSMKKFLKLRHNLFPYIYTMNYQTYSEYIPIVRPIYYYHSEDMYAYRYRNNYYFGSEMLVMPITSKADPELMLGRADGYIPEGDWFDFFRGTLYTGGRRVSLYRPIDEIPVLCKAGAIVPMTDREPSDNRLGICDKLDMVVFPGADNSFEMYEDEGEGEGYRDGKFCKTLLSLKWGEKPVFTIGAAKGDLSLLPATRDYKLHFRGVSADTKAAVNGRELEGVYDVMTATLTVEIKNVATSEELSVTLESECGFKPDDSAKTARIKAVIHVAKNVEYNRKLDLDRFMNSPFYSDTELIKLMMHEGLSKDLVAAAAEYM